MIEDLLSYNEEFVKNKGYEPYQTSKYPDRRLAIVTCMDTRLIELLPAALGIKNGDAKIIKNAGGVITHPFGSVVRSLLIAIYELGVENSGYRSHGLRCTAYGCRKFAGENMRKRGISNNATILAILRN